MMSGPPFLDLDKLNPEGLEQMAWQIVRDYPESERANSSGKFYRNYRCWHFHKSSNHPLVRSFVEAAEKSADAFAGVYSRPLEIDFVILSYVEDASQEICLWHRDGYFFDGQAHLTVLGGANIEVEGPGENLVLRRKTGDFWYLNGSHYRHRILSSAGPRIEICAPVSQRREDVALKWVSLSEDPLRLLDGNNPDWIQLRRKQSRHVLNAVTRGTASNLNIAEFSVDLT